VQVLMAAGAVPAVKENATPMLLAGWELFTGAGTAEDGARVGLLLAIARRLTDAIMLMVARQRRGEGDELLSPLIRARDSTARRVSTSARTEPQSTAFCGVVVRSLA
jgi:hypothetical protein